MAASVVCATSADMAHDGALRTPGVSVPIVSVPCASELLDRWDKLGDFREAFVSWGEDFLAGFDKAHAEGRLPWQQDIDLHAYNEALHQPGQWGEKDDPISILADTLLPHWRVGVKMSELAVRADLTASTIVMALLGQKCGRKFQNYLDAEEMVLSGAPDLTVAGVSRACDIGDGAARRLFRQHNVERRSTACTGEKSKVRIMAEDLMENGTPPREVLPVLQATYPDMDLSQLTQAALYNWRVGMKRHGRL